MKFGIKLKMKNRDNNWLERSLLLVGEGGLRRLQGASIAVIGLGGVGAFAAEMIARAGVGKMVIVDSDVVGMSNKNRQLLALDSTMGMEKCDVMWQRILDINPGVELLKINKYLTEENVADLFLQMGRVDFVVDAIDTLSPKISLISYCVENKIPLVSSMGAGAKFDATKVKIADISKSFNCPLAYILRKKLRKVGISSGFKVVFSEELPLRDAIVEAEERNKKSQVGTISYLPAAFGIVCAQTAINFILNKQ